MECRLSAQEQTDEDLMAALRQGNDSALAGLVHRYQNDIFRFCLHYVRDAEVARELTQETFLRVYTASSRFDLSRLFRPWVLCIARNLCINELNRKKTVTMERLEEYASSARTESGEIVQLRFSGDGPDGALMAQERRELLLEAVESLDEESRELVKLRFFERMSAKVIAEVIGSTEGAVRTKVHRVLVGLRDRYGARGDDL